jgi:hypothetical protein
MRLSRVATAAAVAFCFTGCSGGGFSRSTADAIGAPISSLSPKSVNRVIPNHIGPRTTLRANVVPLASLGPSQIPPKASSAQRSSQNSTRQGSSFVGYYGYDLASGSNTTFASINTSAYANYTFYDPQAQFMYVWPLQISLPDDGCFMQVAMDLANHAPPAPLPATLVITSSCQSTETYYKIDSTFASKYFINNDGAIPGTAIAVGIQVSGSQEYVLVHNVQTGNDDIVYSEPWQPYVGQDGYVRYYIEDSSFGELCPTLNPFYTQYGTVVSGGREGGFTSAYGVSKINFAPFACDQNSGQNTRPDMAFIINYPVDITGGLDWTEYNN